MPSGKVHRRITRALVLVTLPGALLDPRLLVFSVGVATGLIIDPDLDVEGWTEAELGLKEVWAPLGWIWQKFWWPYGKLAAHRGLSHMPILGTAGRALYLMGPILLVLALVGLRLPWWALGLWFAGLCLADLGHIVADVVWSWIKKWVRRRRR